MAEHIDDLDLSLSQATRPLQITTPLDGEPLVLTDFAGSEGLSQLFHFTMSFISEEEDIDFSELLGKRVSVTAALPNDSTRTWNGVVTQFGQNGRDDWFCYYSAVMEPSVVELRHRSNYRIFQEQTIDDILDTLLKDFDTEVSYAHTDQRPARNYCVQYGETDFDFISRLMEESGLFYYFKHADDKDTLVLTDDVSQCAAIPGLAAIAYMPPGGGVAKEPSIKSWQKAQRLAPTSVLLRDTHFQAPRETFEATRDVEEKVTVGKVSHTLKPADSKRVVYGYPAGYAPHFDGIGSEEQDPEVDEAAPTVAKQIEDAADLESRRQCEYLATRALQIVATSDVIELAPGGLFTAESPKFYGNGDYLVTRVTHTMKVGVGAGSGSSDDPLDYQNEFACLPSGMPFQPPRQTPKPVIAGVQTARVVADLVANEADAKELCEQFYDKYGRVKVCFPWDRRDDKPAKDEAAQPAAGDEEQAETAGVADRSCWVRVAQIWAGNRWGAFFWPRHGHEVLVAFEHGDPDRPVIVGSLYNAENMPPLEMPKKQMMAGIMSCSVNGVASESSNGFTFHDLFGNEHFETHSESSSFSVNEDSEHNIVMGTSVSVNGSFFPW